MTLSVGYDARLRPNDFEVGGRPSQFGPPTAMKTQFEYYPDDTPRYSHDVLDERFDRAFSFDHAGGLKEAYSGSEARDFINNTNSGTTTGPFRQSYQHDAFGNMTNRANRFWSHSDTFTANYANNRRQDPAFQYDASGQLTHDSDLQYTYDATGKNASIYSAAANQTITGGYDGLGRAARRAVNENGASTDVTYYIWSTVIGKVITELYENGEKRKGNVYLGDQVIAIQQSAWVVWRHDDPVSGTRGVSSRDGGYSIEVQPDPMGVNVGSEDPFINCCGNESPPEQGMINLLAGSGVPNGRCTLDGMTIDCGWARELMEMEAVAVEFLIHDHKGWHVEQSPIVSFGLGIFGFDSPIIRHDNEGPKIGWQALVFSFAPQNPAIRSVPLGNLKQGLEDLLKKKDCADYVQKLLDEANRLSGEGYPHINTIWEGYNKINGAGGFQLDGVASNGGTVSGDLFANGASLGTVHLKPYRTNGRMPTARETSEAQSRYAYTALHEIFHLARQGGFSDFQMASAAYSLAKMQAPKHAKDDSLTWSGEFDGFLGQHCPNDTTPKRKPWEK